MPRNETYKVNIDIPEWKLKMGDDIEPGRLPRSIMEYITTPCITFTLENAGPIVSTHLEDKYGFECKVDYDKDFETIATYKKKIVGNLEIHITDTPKYQSPTVEIVQGTEFQEIKIDKMWQLLMLIDMLQGVQLPLLNK